LKDNAFVATIKAEPLTAGCLYFLNVKLIAKNAQGDWRLRRRAWF
jgi:hypothetical protein